MQYELCYHTNSDIYNALEMKVSWFDMILALILVIITLFLELIQIC